MRIDHFTVLRRNLYFVCLFVSILAVLALIYQNETYRLQQSSHSQSQNQSELRDAENEIARLDKELKLMQKNLAYLKDFLDVRFNEIERATENLTNQSANHDLTHNARLGSAERIRLERLLNLYICLEG